VKIIFRAPSIAHSIKKTPKAIKKKGIELSQV